MQAKNKPIAIPVLTNSKANRFRWAQSFIPHDEIETGSEHIFHYESRRLNKHGAAREDLKRSSWRRVALVVFVFLGFNLLSTLPDPRPVNYDLLSLLVGLSLLDKFYLDFIILAAGADSISQDRNQNRWDLICLSDLSMTDWLKAKHAVTQILAWRATVTVMAFRLCLALALLWTVLNELTLSMGRQIDPLQVLTAWTMLLSALVFATIYVVEPRWRLRALAAGSLRASAFARDTTGGFLRVAGTFFRMWWTQFSTVAGVIVGTYFLFACPLSIGLSAGGFDADIIAPVIPLFFAAFSWRMIRSSYRVFANKRLTETHEQLMKLGGAP